MKQIKTIFHFKDIMDLLNSTQEIWDASHEENLEFQVLNLDNFDELVSKFEKGELNFIFIPLEFIAGVYSKYTQEEVQEVFLGKWTEQDKNFALGKHGSRIVWASRSINQDMSQNESLFTRVISLFRHYE